MKILWFDVETTGLNNYKNDIIQLACLVEKEGKIVEEKEFRMRPFDLNAVEQEALNVNGRTLEEIKAWPDPKQAFRELISFLGNHVSKYDRADKFYPAGFNVNFDVGFLKNFFKKNGDNYFGSWFNYKYIDPLQLVFVLEYCGECRFPNNRLGTLCQELGIEIKAHDAMSDIKATYELMKKLRENMTFNGLFKK